MSQTKSKKGEPLETVKKTTESAEVLTLRNNYQFVFIYPPENPTHAIADIAKAMEYTGIFDGIKKE